MSDQSQRYRNNDTHHKRIPNEYGDKRRSRSRSRQRHHSRSRSPNDSRHKGMKRHQRHRYRDESRSRSRSMEKRHRRRRSHSKLNEYGSNKHRHRESRRHKESRSRSKSRNKQNSRSDSRTRTHNDHREQKGESRSHSYTVTNDNDRIPPPPPKIAYEELVKENKYGKTEESDSNHSYTDKYIQNLPLPNEQDPSTNVGAYYDLDTDEPIDKERIHREMEEKLRLTLAKEGKVYPPPKPEASHPVFANDGSFLEIFKKMQEAQKHQQQQILIPHTNMVNVPMLPPVNVLPTASTGAYVATTSTGKSGPPVPIVGRRRGGKILKTGLVAKQKSQNDSGTDPKDFWSLYLAEVNKYKSHACESESGNRPLVK